MSEYLFAPRKPVTLPIVGGQLFPVRRVFAVARNYADHAREMGGNPDRESPFFFHKPGDGVTTAREVPYPPATERLDYEVELVVAINRGGASIRAEDAFGHIFGYTVGCDLTRRDMQAAASKAGRPWDMAKAFDNSAVASTLQPATRIGHPDKGFIRLSVNGTVRQDGDLVQMIWTVPEIIGQISSMVRLEPGDLVYTGTPSGIGPVNRGDHIEMTIENVGQHDFVLV